jgi:hypothetical protein
MERLKEIRGGLSLSSLLCLSQSCNKLKGKIFFLYFFFVSRRSRGQERGALLLAAFVFRLLLLFLDVSHRRLSSLGTQVVDISWIG